MSMALSACLSAAIALILQGAAASAEVRLLYSITAPVARLEGLAADLDTAEVSDFLVPMQAADAPPEGARRRKPVMGRAEVMRGGLVLPQIGQPVPSAPCRWRASLSFLPELRQPDLRAEIYQTSTGLPGIFALTDVP